jgi:hypothetical protein
MSSANGDRNPETIPQRQIKPNVLSADRRNLFSRPTLRSDEHSGGGQETAYGGQKTIDGLGCEIAEPLELRFAGADELYHTSISIILQQSISMSHS